MIAINSVSYPFPAHSLVPRDTHTVTDEIIHHSGGSLEQTALDIDAEHRGEGWSMIGYNYVIVPNGAIYAGRPIEYIPSAAFGRNAESVNICLIGNFEVGDAGYTGMPSQKQLASLRDLSVHLHKMLPSITRTIAHGDVASMFYPADPGNYSTACCGSRLKEFLPALRTFVREQLA